MWKSAKILLLLSLVAWPMLPDSLTDKAPALIGMAYRHSAQTIGSINDWDNHDWIGVASVFLASILALRKLLFWRPTKVKTVIERVVDFKPDGITTGQMPAPLTLEELLEKRIKGDIAQVVSLVRSAIGEGYDKIEEISVAKHSRPGVIGALKRQLPAMDFKFEDTSDEYENCLDLTWSPASGGATVP